MSYKKEGFIKEGVGNPKADREVRLYRFFSRRTDGEKEFYRSLFYEFGSRIDGEEQLSIKQKRLLDELRQYHKNRLINVLNILQPKEGEMILDAGCGTGAITYHSAKKGATVIGIDISKGFLRLAQSLINDYSLNTKVKYICQDITKLPCSDATFNKIVCCDTLEHMPEDEKIRAIREFYRVLKPMGYVVAHTDNIIRVILGVLFRKILAILTFKNPSLYNIPFKGAEGTGGHIGLTTYFRLKTIFRKAKFTNIKVKFDPINIAYIPKLITPIQRLLGERMPLLASIYIGSFTLIAYKR